MRFDNGIEMEDVDGGLLVRQHGDAYVARGWRLTKPTIELVQTALDSGLRWMIREGHPQSHARWPAGQGRVYLAFSPTREQQWSVAIDTFRDGKGDFSHGAFNGKYHQQFLSHRVPFEFEKRNRGAGHMNVPRDRVLPTLRLMRDLDHSVLYLSRTEAVYEGFALEYDIQRSLLFLWDQTPFGQRHRLVGDEFPVDPGLNPRRIDILARNPKNGDWLVIEVKRAEATIEAVRQIEGYMLTLARRDDFLGGAISGALVAERVPSDVRRAANSAGIEAYEVAYPLELERVA